MDLKGGNNMFTRTYCPKCGVCIGFDPKCEGCHKQLHEEVLCLYMFETKNRHYCKLKCLENETTRVVLEKIV